MNTNMTTESLVSKLHFKTKQISEVILGCETLVTDIQNSVVEPKPMSSDDNTDTKKCYASKGELLELQDRLNTLYCTVEVLCKNLREIRNELCSQPLQKETR